MPTYAYRCERCQHQFEVFARMSDPDPEVCQSCGAAALVKVMFPVAVHYKGSGFYSTDYSGKKAAPAADSSTTSSDSAPAAAPSTSDSSSASSSSTSSSSDA